MKQDKKFREYRSLFPANYKETTISSRLKTMEKSANVDKLREKLCDQILYKMVGGIFDCPNMRVIRKDKLFPIYKENVKALPDTYHFHWMTYSLYNDNKKGFYHHFDNLVKTISGSNKSITEDFVIDCLIVPLKDATTRFWKYAQKRFISINTDEGVVDICKLMEQYYKAESYDDACNILLKFIQKNPDNVVAMEYLANSYAGCNRWHEALAYLEDIKKPRVYARCMDCFYFDLAWIYDKVGEIEKEEENYRKSIQIREDKAFANNNLGWCLIKQKRYPEAEKVFNKCLKNEWDAPNSSNGFVQVMIDTGRNKEAKAFIREGRHKVSMATIRRVEELPNKNVKKREDNKSEKEHKTGARRNVRNIKRVQFSSEKALEDEIAAKLKQGARIFDKQLQIYEKKGKYGRQYVTSKGIIDLLCKDYKGDIYVIELKKDSGYKDAYEQVTTYMDCISKEPEFASKRIRGIICLNSPPKSLIKKVSDDDRVTLFEYYIDYREIR